MTKKPIENCGKLPQLKKDKTQIHVEVACDQRLEFKAARKKLGYGTDSEALRECIRWIIAKADELESESVPKAARGMSLARPLEETRSRSAINVGFPDKDCLRYLSDLLDLSRRNCRSLKIVIEPGGLGKNARHWQVSYEWLGERRDVLSELEKPRE